MKQTNNAIKFLMAQYRAIFKNAYFKGMATALVLTAGLAAGQAQAADTVYEFNSGTDINKITTPVGTHDSGTKLPLQSAAAHNGTGTSVSDKTLSIGTDEMVSSTTGWATAGILVNSGAGATATNLSATNNKLDLNKGALVTRGAYGAYLYNEKGNVSATGNRIEIKDIGNSETVTVSATGNGYGLFGARVNSTNGSATASGNYVDISAHYGATLTLNHGNNGIVGALAEGTDTVSVTGNYVTISGTGTDAGKDAAHRLDLGSAGTNAHTLIGGFALNQTSGSAAGDMTASTLTAASNYVTATNISIGGASGAYIFGGRAMNHGSADGHADIFARNNTVTLSNTFVQSTSDSADDDMQIIGNAAQVYTSAGPKDGGVNSINAIGDGTTVNLSITDGSLSYTSDGNKTSSFDNLSSVAAGGVAFTNNTSSGGNVTAIRNVADIKSTTATNVNFYGGAALNYQANANDQAIASENTLRLDSTSIDASGANYINYVVGGLAQLTKGTADFDKASATASSNTVSVTHSEYTDTDLNVEADIYGAYVDTGTTSGAAITASHNAVTVGDNIKVTGDVIGAQASHNGTFVGNTVEFDATLNAAKTIAGVTISSGTTTTGVTAEKPDVITLTGNTVTLGANAETTNVSIYAAKLGSNNKDDNNTQIIHSGNTAIANGTHIYDDGANHDIAADDIQIGSTALIHVKNSTTLDISGLITGDSKYLNGTGTVADGARIVNQGGTINVFNSLAVQGDDSLIAASEGALLAVNGGSGANATHTNNGLDSVTKEGATLKISAAGLTNYLTAPEGADSTPSYDLDGDGVNETYDKKLTLL